MYRNFSHQKCHIQDNLPAWGKNINLSIRWLLLLYLPDIIWPCFWFVSDSHCISYRLCNSTCARAEGNNADVFCNQILCHMCTGSSTYSFAMKSLSQGAPNVSDITLSSLYLYNFSGSSKQTTTQFNLPAGNNCSLSFQYSTKLWSIFGERGCLSYNVPKSTEWIHLAIIQALKRIIWCRCSPIDLGLIKTKSNPILIIVNIWSIINVMLPWCDQYSVSYNLYFHY